MEVYNVLSFQKATDPYIFDLYVLGSYKSVHSIECTDHGSVLRN